MHCHPGHLQRVSHFVSELAIAEDARKKKTKAGTKRKQKNIPSPWPKRATNPPPSRSPKTPLHYLSLPPHLPPYFPPRPASIAQNTPRTSPPSRPCFPAGTTPARPQPPAALAPLPQAGGPDPIRSAGCGSGKTPGWRRRREASTTAGGRLCLSRGRRSWWRPRWRKGR